MSDRELLELAAKAAGYEYAKHGGYIVVDGIPGNWNPLTDDGDALRLAVMLRMDICRPHKKHDCVCVWDDAARKFIEEPHGTDPYAATRRAIVRAAAEIGRSKP